MTTTILDTMVGRTLVRVDGAEAQSSQVTFVTADGWTFRFAHSQECCEIVQVEEVVGDVQDLIGRPLLLAECVDSDDDEREREDDPCEEWTFYKFATTEGAVTFRWLGNSNGCYSTDVSVTVTSPRGEKVEA